MYIIIKLYYYYYKLHYYFYIIYDIIIISYIVCRMLWLMLFKISSIVISYFKILNNL